MARKDPRVDAYIDDAADFAKPILEEIRRRMHASIPGLGETRRKRLVKELGGVTAVKAAELDTLQGLSWLPDSVATAVYEKIHGSP